jgi:hypothetical protein
MMLSEDQLRDVLAERASESPTGSAVVTRLLSQEGVAPRPRRRHRASWVAGAAAVALTVTVTAFGVRQATDGGQGTDPPSHLIAAPVAPDGMKLVGSGQIVVTVPDTWGTNQIECGTPSADTVNFGVHPVQLCQITPTPDFSAVTIIGASTEQGQAWVDETSRAGTVGTFDLFLGPLSHDNGRYFQLLAVPDQDVVMSISSPDGDLVNTIVDSVQALDNGVTTVPDVAGLDLTAAEEKLASAGLSVTTTSHAVEDYHGPRVLSVVPQIGSVVTAGSTIQLTIAAEQ